MLKLLFSLLFITIMCLPSNAAEYLVCTWAVPKLDYFPSQSTIFEMDNQNKKLTVTNGQTKTPLTIDAWNEDSIFATNKLYSYYFNRISGYFEYVRDGVIVGRGNCSKVVNKKF